jgi:adenylyltransferase/sulfurtransferase
MSEAITLTDDEIKRYDRHLKLANFGLEKQKKLKQAKILIVGAGGLGCPVALYLAAAGVGKITIVDNDKIELSNLQRQIAFSVNEIGQFKAKALANRINQLNPKIEVTELSVRIDAGNVEEVVDGYDLVIDGTDNFATRFLIADACYLAKISYLHASVYQYQGQISLFVASKTPCFRCLFRKPPAQSALPPCVEAGILGAITGIIGSMAATEAIKYITGLDNSIAGKLLTYDALNEQFKKFDIEPDENCPLCGRHASIKKNSSIKNSSINDVQKFAREHIDNANCEKRLEAHEQIISIDKAAELLQGEAKKKIFLLDVREEHEYKQGHIEDANLWALSEIQALPVDLVRTKFKAKLKNSISKNNNGIASTILCYCQRGARSLKAVNILREAGIDNAFSLEGGLDAWKALSGERL